MALLLLFVLSVEPFAGWTQRFARGGSIWELRDGTCAQVRVTAHGRGVASLEGDDWRMEGVFEFAQSRA